MSLKKLLIIVFIFLSCKINAQEHSNESVLNPQAQKGWHLLDLKIDGVYGISLERTYAELLKGKNADKVIVAVIDGGIDIDHEDLKSSIFTNLKEIPGNGKDDDGNGYIDDVHGWNFMGSSKGSFIYDNIDLIRELRTELKKNPNSKKAKELQTLVDSKKKPLENAYNHIDSIRKVIDSIKIKIGKSNPTIDDLKKYIPRNIEEAKILVNTVKSLKEDPNFRIENDEMYKKYKYQLDYLININYDPRAGNEEFGQKYYGNGDVKGTQAFHGTHVAGIIAANRNNNLGAKGISNDLIILPIRAIPIGDAYDHDVAKAIHYAVDMGAKVINLSYLKGTSLSRAEMDEAVKYAMTKNVLIVHGAGNDGLENTTGSTFPTKFFLDGCVASAWLEVGASSLSSTRNVNADFSNYSKTLVDLFAPGVSIYSTIPNDKYMFLNGTSMAAPIVSGLAGMLIAYYPKLTAMQLKEILMKSVVKSESLLDKCISGGIVNAYRAFKLADTY